MQSVYIVKMAKGFPNPVLIYPAGYVIGLLLDLGLAVAHADESPHHSLHGSVLDIVSETY